MFNDHSIARLAELYPELARLIEQIDAQLPAASIQVTRGIATWAEQDALYAQGRTTPGKIVTHAPGGYSWHNYGLAADLVPEDIAPGQPDWNLSHPVWARMVSVAEHLGLVSGAEWHGEDLDTPHVQLTGRFPVTPNDEVRAIYARRNSIQDVWQEAFS